MNSPSNPNLSDEILRRIDQACDDFESAWKDGSRPFVDDVLSDFPENARTVLLEELLPIEIAWRHRSGETPTADSYLFRFPNLDPDVLNSLLKSDATTDADDEGTQAISGVIPGIETPADFDSEFISTGNGELSFDDLSVEAAELVREFDTLGVLDARVVLATLGASGQPLDQLAAPDVITLLSEQQLLSQWQRDKLASGNPESLVLGDYVLIDPLGKGGMGVVYRARHRRMDRLVALKTLTDQATESDDSVQRFQREVRAAARLSHPNIVAAYDAGEHNDTHYLVMELVDGIDLSRLVRQSGPLNAATAIDYIRQAAAGFAYAHSRGIIHRDIKPQNLLVDREQHVRILDMGLARLNPANAASEPASTSSAGQTELTQSGVIMGTVDFMSPEQATNTRNANERSDIYSLGCTLYFLLTGRAMFDGETCMERLLAHHQESRPSLITTVSKIPPALEEVFTCMTARQPADRYESMDDVVEALERLRSTLDASFLEEPDDAHSQAVSEEVDAAQTLVEQAAAEKTFITRAAASVDAPDESFASPDENMTRTRSPAGRAGLIRASVSLAVVCLLIWWLWPENDQTGETDTGSQTVASPDASEELSLTLLPDRPQPECAWPEAVPIQRRQREVAEKFGITPFVENTIGMVLAVVPTDEDGVRPFLVGTTEVTVRQFGLFVDETGYELQTTSRYGLTEGANWTTSLEFSFRNLGDLAVSPDFPACSICWLDAQAFCAWLSERENADYRLPTVAEWQAANAAGNDAKWFFGNDDARLGEFAWFQVNSGHVFHDVGGKRPNALGLFDTLGNEYEWCQGAASIQVELEFRPQIGGGFGDPAAEIARSVRAPEPVRPDRGLHGAFRIIRELPDVPSHADSSK